MNPIDSFCSRCGAPATSTTYPRICAGCGAQVWANPIPVAVLLAPVIVGERTGLLVVRRGIPPVGLLALPGGFAEAHEPWQAAAARETREEADVEVDPAAIAPFWFASSAPRPDRVLLFGVLADALDPARFPAFTPTAETIARGVVFGPDGLDDVVAFPLHREAARRWFAARAITGAHDVAPV